MNSGKPKTKDQSSNKFLQRIAGKKAIGPPPTPRPVIGEHPVRTLLRENADEIEDTQSAAPLQPEAVSGSIRTPDVPTAAAAPPSPPPPPAQMGSAPHISAEFNASSGGSTISQQKSAAGEAVGEGRGKTLDIPAESEQKPAPVIAEESNAGGGTKRADVVGIRTKLNESAPGFGRAEETIINIRNKYRLNSGEFSVYRELYLMTHAVGKSECSFVVSELVTSTGMLERRIRDNLRRLKKNGWLVLLEGYDFQKREKATYRINTEPRY